jgi:hypothetical protein
MLALHDQGGRPQREPFGGPLTRSCRASMARLVPTSWQPSTRWRAQDVILVAYLEFVPLPCSQCRFATLLDARPRGPIAQGDPGRSMRRLERAAKRPMSFIVALWSPGSAPRGNGTDGFLLHTEARVALAEQPCDMVRTASATSWPTENQSSDVVIDITAMRRCGAITPPAWEALISER